MNFSSEGVWSWSIMIFLSNSKMHTVQKICHHPSLLCCLLPHWMEVKKKRGSGGNLQAIRLSFSQEAKACCNIVQALPVALLCVTNNGRIEETASYIFLKRLTG